MEEPDPENLAGLVLLTFGVNATASRLRLPMAGRALRSRRRPLAGQTSRLRCPAWPDAHRVLARSVRSSRPISRRRRATAAFTPIVVGRGFSPAKLNTACRDVRFENHSAGVQTEPPGWVSADRGVALRSRPSLITSSPGRNLGPCGRVCRLPFERPAP